MAGKRVWQPLEPGVHEYEGGSVIVEEDGFFTRTYTLSLRKLNEGDVSKVSPMPYRLCQSVDVETPGVPALPAAILDIILEALDDSQLYTNELERVSDAEKAAWSAKCQAAIEWLNQQPKPQEANDVQNTR